MAVTISRPTAAVPGNQAQSAAPAERRSSRQIRAGPRDRLDQNLMMLMMTTMTTTSKYAGLDDLV